MKVYRDAAGPRVLRQLTESVQVGLETGVFSDEAKQANEDLVENFKVRLHTYAFSHFSGRFLGTPLRLRDDIPRDSVTPGQNGTTYLCMGCDPRGTCLCGNEFLLSSLARERDILVCEGCVCAGMGFFYTFP